MIFSLVYMYMHTCICMYKGYKYGRLKSMFSKATVVVANNFGKYMVCQTWERQDA